MNALTVALQEIQYAIPNELLFAAFTINDPPETNRTISLEEKIRTKCIKPRVLRDCNIVGGVELIVPLFNIVPSIYNDLYTVYNISAEYTNNREIISALSLVQMPFSQINYSLSGIVNTGYATNYYGTNSLTSIGTRIGLAQEDTTFLTNVHLQLIGFNTVAVYANYASIAPYGIRCFIENENNLTNISPRSYKNFAQLCIKAVKSYIYSTLIIKVNTAYLQSGQELTVFKSILDSYESAEEEYNTYLREVWQAVSVMNDTMQYNRLLKTMIHPGL